MGVIDRAFLKETSWIHANTLVEKCCGNLSKLTQEELEVVFESDHRRAPEAMRIWEHVETYGHGMP